MADLYKSYGDLESMVSRLISRQVPNQIENTFGRYTAIRAVQERGQFVIDAAAALKGVVCGRGRNPTLRLWPAIFSGEIDVFPSERRNMGQEI
ncbi:hypothetical protein ACRCPI_31505, partial [Pseudomonas aeruginosa]